MIVSLRGQTNKILKVAYLFILLLPYSLFLIKVGTLFRRDKKNFFIHKDYKISLCLSVYMYVMHLSLKHCYCYNFYAF